jgi:hypothetical protein
MARTEVNVKLMYRLARAGDKAQAKAKTCEQTELDNLELLTRLRGGDCHTRLPKAPKMTQARPPPA